jgi:hypothetical protein
LYAFGWLYDIVFVDIFRAIAPFLMEMVGQEVDQRKETPLNDQMLQIV